MGLYFKQHWFVANLRIIANEPIDINFLENASLKHYKERHFYCLVCGRHISDNIHLVFGTIV